MHAWRSLVAHGSRAASPRLAGFSGRVATADAFLPMGSLAVRQLHARPELRSVANQQPSPNASSPAAATPTLATPPLTPSPLTPTPTPHPRPSPLATSTPAAPTSTPIPSSAPPLAFPSDGPRPPTAGSFYNGMLSTTAGMEPRTPVISGGWTRSYTAGPAPPVASAPLPPRGGEFNVQGEALQSIMGHTSAEDVLLDTLRLVRRLEQLGIESKKAEQMTALLVDIVQGNYHRIDAAFTRKTDIDRIMMLAETRIRQSVVDQMMAQEREIARLTRENEDLRADSEKQRVEVRYAVDKLASAQRLDMNMQRTRIGDDIARMDSRTMENNTRLERDLDEMRVYIERMKNDVITYSIGSILSCMTAVAALLRIFM